MKAGVLEGRDRHHTCAKSNLHHQHHSYWKWHPHSLLPQSRLDSNAISARPAISPCTNSALDLYLDKGLVGPGVLQGSREIKVSIKHN